MRAGLRYDSRCLLPASWCSTATSSRFPSAAISCSPCGAPTRPQKGRYREFYQFDADMIVSDSLLNELELVQMIDLVFQRLGIAITVKINNRKILAGIADMVGAPDKLTDITVAIDKLDKIGLDNVRAELAERGLTAAQIAALEPIFALSGTPDDKLDRLAALFAGNAAGSRVVEEMRTPFRLIGGAMHCAVELDLTLARGLNYYTGAIFEVKANDVAMGSICGGGRYDNLTGIFGMADVSGVGISFGADRIYDVLTELGLFPPSLDRRRAPCSSTFGDRSWTTASRRLP